MLRYPRLTGHGERGRTLLQETIDKRLPPDADENAKEKLAKRQANAAVALLRLAHPEKVWPLLKRTPPDDPRLRSYLIHRLGPMGADVGTIVKRLDDEPDVTIRRALYLSLGEFSEEQLPEDARSLLLPKLKEVHGNGTDPGLHSAVEWLLRHWKEDAWLKQVNEEWTNNERERNQRIDAIQQLIKKGEKKTPPQWYVNSQGQTMVVIPGPVQFEMGSPPTEDGRSGAESQHKRRIGRSFALAVKVVTVGEFRRFVKENKLEGWFKEDGQVVALIKRHSPEEDCPIIFVDWYTAARYCNWLSKVESIPKEQWCYETDPAGKVTALKAKYPSLHGYRLPNEAEWEYACRAGAVTSRYYGETEELLPWYGWYLNNSGGRTRPVGKKKPNDLGLFDMHGNVLTWCQESAKGDYAASPDGQAIDDEEDRLPLSKTSRVLRGGTFTFGAVYVRSAYRYSHALSDSVSVVGFRPARTLPLGSFTALPPNAEGSRK